MLTNPQSVFWHLAYRHPPRPFCKSPFYAARGQRHNTKLTLLNNILELPTQPVASRPSMCHSPGPGLRQRSWHLHSTVLVVRRCLNTPFSFPDLAKRPFVSRNSIFVYDFRCSVGRRSPVTKTVIFIFQLQILVYLEYQTQI